MFSNGSNSSGGASLGSDHASEPRMHASNVEGHFDGFENGHLIGWARFAGEPISITAVIDGEELDEARSDQRREDLYTGGYGDCAFGIPVPAKYLDGKAHNVELRLSDIGLTILNSPQILIFPDEGVRDGGESVRPTPEKVPGDGVTNGKAKQVSTTAEGLGHIDSDAKAHLQYFDSEFYLQVNTDVARSGVGALEHYSSFGWKELRDPCKSLSVFDYIAGRPELIATGDEPLLHWVRNGRPAVEREERRTRHLSSFLVPQDKDMVSELLDPLFIFTSNKGVQRLDERRFIESSERGPIAFNPLFDCDYYARRAGIGGTADELRKHYLKEGWRAGLSPHPIFDVTYYESQLSAPLKEPALVHYLREGWQAGLSPSPLFDPYHYSRRARIGDNVNPLVHYLLLATRDAEPHYLFSDARFIAIAGDQVSSKDLRKSPLELFFSRRSLQKLSTHLYFEPQHYTAELSSLPDGPVKERLQQKLLKQPPLIHYLQHGANRAIETSIHFWPDFYREQLLASGRFETEADLPADLLQHYLRDGGKETFSPSPLISLSHLADQCEDFEPQTDEALAYVLRQPPFHRPDPTSLFRGSTYCRIHEDIRVHEVCPVEHFLMHAMEEQRLPHWSYSRQYASRFWGLAPHRNVLENYFMSHALQPKTRFLFTSHDASRTGAPGIVLRLIKDLSKIPGVECFCILDRGGELLPDFQAVAHTHVLTRSVYQVGPDCEEHRREIGDLLDGISIDYAICNSFETRHIAQYLDELGIRTIMLMHEVPDLYPEQELQFAIDKVSHIVFPSMYIRDKMLTKVDLDESLYSVIGQGLLNDEFGHWPRQIAREEVLKELSLPQDAFLVLGCGTIDFRKGIDHFVAAAGKVLAQPDSSDRSPIYFLWFGHGDRRPGTAAGFVIDQLKQQGIYDRVRFVGTRPNMAKYMAACDVFFMSSRADPFPCVIHEALASSLPVVYFNEGGGAGELVDEDGVGVPIGDVEAAATAVLEYRRDSKTRKKVGDRARQKILQKWRSPDYASKLLELLSVEFSANERLDQFRSVLDGQGKASKGSARKPRSPIYLLSPDWSTSGVNTYTRNLIEGLCSLGWDAQLLFTRGAETKFDRDADGHTVFPDVPYSFVYPETNDPDGICKALLAFLGDAPECIVVPNYDYIASSIAPVTSPKVHWVGIAHSDHIEHYEHVYRLGHYWDAIVPVSGQVQDGILKLNASFSDKTHRIFCGVEPQKSEVIKRDPSKIRLAYAGRMVTEQKQVGRFIDLAEALETLGVPYELNMIGDGDLLPELRQASVRIPGLRVHGRCSSEKTLDLMKQNDVFVLLSDYEGLPMSLVEAFSTGLVPVVFPIESGIGEVLTSGKNGVITKSPSVQQVALEVKRLHEDRALLEKLSAESRATIDRVGLSLQHMSKAYSDLFEQVLRNATGKNEKERTPNFAWRSSDGILPPVNAGSFI